MEENADLIAIQRAIYQLVRLYASRRAFTEWSSGSGVSISRAEFDLLTRVVERGSLTLGDLGQMAQVDPGAVSRRIRSLEELGLVERSPDPSDRRVSRVAPSILGKEVQEKVSSIGAKHLSKALENWTKSDQAALASLLATLVGDLRDHEYSTIHDASVYGQEYKSMVNSQDRNFIDQERKAQR